MNELIYTPVLPATQLEAYHAVTSALQYLQDSSDIEKPIFNVCEGFMGDFEQRYVPTNLSAKRLLKKITTNCNNSDKFSETVLKGLFAAVAETQGLEIAQGLGIAQKEQKSFYSEFGGYRSMVQVAISKGSSPS